MKNGCMRVSVVCFVLFLSFMGAVADRVMAQESYFSITEMQILANFDRQPVDSDIWQMTIEHFGEVKYGDHYFLLDIEGQEDFDVSPGQFYFLYKPRLSLDKVFNRKIIPVGFLGEFYAALQYSSSSNIFLNQAWYYGISFDFAFHPNYGYSNLNIFLRDEDTQDLSYHIDYTWEQPFSIGKVNLNFKGWMDFWADDTQQYFLTEPQLRFNLSTFGNNYFLSRTAIGIEVEASYNVFGIDYGWEVNPAIFFAFQI